MEGQAAPYSVERAIPNLGRRVGEFFFGLVLWLLIGMLVQWLMPMSSHLALNDTVNSGYFGNASFWNALSVVALFFTVLAFMLRDFANNNPIAKGFRLVATRVLATTFDLGMFGFGGFLLLWFTGEASEAASGQLTLWQQLFFTNIGVFIVSLVVLGALLFMLRCSQMSLVSVPKLEYKPLLRLLTYIVLCVALVVIAFFMS